MADNEQNKLLGVLTLDYSQVKKAVEETNQQLASLGKNSEFDMTSVVEKEFDKLYKRLEKKVKDTATHIAAVSKDMGSGMASTEASSKNVLSVVESIGKGGSIKKTTTYISELGQKCKIVEKDGKLVAKSITSIGERAKDIQLFNETMKESSRLLKERHTLQVKMLSMKSDSQEYQDAKIELEVLDAQIEQNKTKLEQLKRTEQHKKQILELNRQEQALTKEYASAKEKSENKSEAALEKEALSLISKKSSLLSQIHNLNLQILTAQESQKPKQEEHKGQLMSLLRLIEDQLDGLLDQNSALRENENIQKALLTLGAKRASWDSQEAKKQEEILRKKRQQEEVTRNIANILASMVSMHAVLSFWNKAVEYSSTYYDMMNEIRIVTQASEEEANRMGESYRKLAEEMSVSSVEIASAAVEFWRQGQDESEVNQRLVDTSQYAKISGLEFKEAAELVTAATNSMSIDSQRVIDVFSYLGDASSSGADEIGQAMQKASASAQEAGVSFEWLGAYIATVSEKTRQAPEVIGTAFNSIMARMQNIKQKGYNEEDATKINDVAKALNKVDIALMDQNGNWRDMSTIFLEIAEQWSTLDDKTRGLLATTLAGTKQKNVFLTLMNDMAKVTSTTGDASRALELYYGALESAGAASEKYAIYQESIAAAKADLTNSLEALYSELANSGVIKGFYSALTSLVDGFTKASEGVGKFNIAIVTLTGSLIALFLSFKSAKLADPKTDFLSFIASGKATIVIAAVTVAVVGQAAAYGKLKEAREAESKPKDFTESISKIENTVTKVRSLRDEYETLLRTENRTAVQEQRMLSIVSSLAGTNDDLRKKLTATNGEFLEGEAALSAMNAALDGYTERLRTLSSMQASENLKDTTGVKTAYDEYEKAGAVTHLKSSFDVVKGKLGKDATDQDVLDKLDMLVYTYTNGYRYQNWEAVDFMISDWEKELLDSWHAQGVVVNGLLDFFDGYKGSETDVVKLMTDLQMLNTSEAENKARAATEDWLENYLIKFMNSGEYSEMSSSVQATVQKLAEDFVKTLEASELNADNLPDIQTAAIEYFEERYAALQAYSESYNEFLKQYKETEDPETRMALQNEQNSIIFGLRRKYGFDIPFVDELMRIEEQSGATEEELENLNTQVEESWKKINEKNKEDTLQEYSDKGWIDHLTTMKDALEEALESGDGSVAQKILEEWLGDTDLISKMMDDFDWADDLYKAIEAQDWQSAMDILISGMEQGKTKIKELKEEMQELADAQALDNLVDSRFSSWLDEIDGFMENRDTTGLFEWFAGKDEKSRSAFLEMYPQAIELFNTLTQNEGKIQTQGEEWEEYAEAMSNATDEYKAWLELNRQAGISNVTDKEGREAAGNLLDSFGERDPGTDALQAFHEANQELSAEQREWLKDNSEAYEDLCEKIADGTAGIEDAEKAMADLAKETEKWNLDEMAKKGEVLEDFPDWVEACYDGGIAFSESLAEATTAMHDLSKAQAYLNGLKDGTITGTEYMNEAYEHLERVTDVSADVLRNNLVPAEQALASQSAATGNMINALRSTLTALTGVNLNTSNWRSQLAALANTATGTAKNLADLLTVLSSTSAVLNGTTPIEVPKFTGGGGGGGGSSKDSGKEVSEIEKMLDLMEDIQKIRKHQREMISTTRDYYENEGYFTTAIKYYEDERASVEENSKVLEENLKKIEALLPAKQKEVAAMSTSDEKYEQAAKDLESLQEAHQEYSLELLENKNTIAEFNNAIKDMQDEIRNMEIELRETILEAIEDREALEERMLDGRIDVENEILDVIKRRYEKERDLAIETAEAKIEALERELDLLDDQLEARKKLADKEDKQLKLAQKQAQLERISVDPTRRKEVLELQKEIAELRDEMAWDLAEEEVEAQKESVEQQITSLEDYIEYVENYYEELFEHPQKLIAEMQEIISKTDAEILEFLKSNNEEYAASTEATMESMVNNWQEMLNDMRGYTETYWEEIEQIIAGGDEAILEFLKTHSEDYRLAGKLQAEAYVDEWKRQLNELSKAYENYYTKLKETEYTPVKPSTGSGSNKGSGGGTGGSSAPQEPQSYSFKFKNSAGFWSGAYTDESMSVAFNLAKKAAISHWSSKMRDADGNVIPEIKSIYDQVYSAALFAPGNYIKQFAKGGLANFTGPAWLDGTPSNPERVLDPKQTKLFEALVASLTSISVASPTMPLSMFEGSRADAYTSTFGDINITVEKLDSETDYQEMAQMVMDEMNRMIARGNSVGGIRKTR